MSNTEQRNAFDIPKSSSFSAELQDYARRSNVQSRVVSNQRRKGIEPMGAMNLPNSGKLSPKERA